MHDAFTKKRWGGVFLANGKATVGYVAIFESLFQFEARPTCYTPNYYCASGFRGRMWLMNSPLLREGSEASGLRRMELMGKRAINRFWILHHCKPNE